MPEETKQTILTAQTSLDLPVPPGVSESAIKRRDMIAAEILAQDPLTAGSVGFMPKALTMATFPYKQPLTPDGQLAQRYVRKSKMWS